MAKTYTNTVKYEIKAKYEISGVVEKPDIVGAIFGQSEGMLGNDMDLKDLQQAGKIGRIEISVNKSKGKTSGEIIIPSSLDQVKTSILAATVETVEKVGPCEADVKILLIRDTRKEKREQITDRAKQLLQKMQKFESVESSELSDNLKSSIRAEKAITYKGMTAGPEIEAAEHIIVVEGRADVLKLLSYGINNAIEMNGSNISKDLIYLCKNNEVIVLIDGDRGGDLNAKKLSSLTNVDYVSRAPDGKEVEELTQKEILLALKRRIPIKEYLSGDKNSDTRGGHDNRRNSSYERSGSYGTRTNNRYDNRSNSRYQSSSRYGSSRDSPYQRNDRNSSYSRDGRRSYGERFDPFASNYRKSNQKTSENTSKREHVETKREFVDIKKYEGDFEKIKGKKKARFFDSKTKKIKDVDAKEVVDAIEKSRKKIDTILMDGIITKRIVEAAEKANIKNVIGIRKSKFRKDKVNTFTIKK